MAFTHIKELLVLNFKDFTQTLLEMPVAIGQVPNVMFIDDKTNNQIYTAIKNENCKVIFHINEYANIVQYKETLYCLDDKFERITYVMSYSKIFDNKLGGNLVYQNAVWANKTLPLRYLVGYPSKIFWEFLYSKYHSLISDTRQTDDGIKFWKNQIKKAFDMKLNVYYLNIQNKLIKLNTYEDVVKDQKYIWGSSSEFDKVRLIITIKDLDNDS